MILGWCRRETSKSAGGGGSTGLSGGCGWCTFSALKKSSISNKLELCAGVGETDEGTGENDPPVEDLEIGAD